MEMDKHFYKILSAFPEFLFLLVGKKSKGKYSFDSVTVKDLKREIDGLLTPKNSRSIHWVLEIQMQKPKAEENIYHRLALEVALLSLRNPKKKYKGILIFGDHSCDSKTEPWCSDWVDSKGFHICFLEELLKQLEEKDPNHPLVLVFKPFYAKNKRKLVKDLPKYYKQIKDSGLEEERVEVLLSVFINWTQTFFNNKSSEEIKKMLRFDTPLRETRSGKELISIGKEEGKEEGIEEGIELGIEKGEVKLATKQLKAKFKEKAESWINKLVEYTEESLEIIAERILFENKIENIFQGLEKK